MMKHAKPTSQMEKAGAALTAFTIALCVCGCPEPPTPVEENPLPLDILLSSPLADGPKGLLPDQIIELAAPLQAPECSNAVYVPQVTVHRLDLEPMDRVALELSGESNWSGTMQDFFGRPRDFARLTDDYRAAVATHSTPELLRRPKERKVSERDIEAVLAGLPASAVVLKTSGGRTSSPPAAWNSVIAPDVSSARKAITSVICVDHDSDEKSSVVVLYEPELPPREPEPSEVEPEPPPFEPEPSEVEPEPPPFEPPPSESGQHAADLCDERLSTLHGRMLDARPDERPGVQKELLAAQNECPWEYRFTYHRATMSVFGTHHHDEAFTLLFRAAEIATVNGSKTEMRRGLTEDGEPSGPFARLTTHHEWRELLHSLEHRD